MLKCLWSSKRVGGRSRERRDHQITDRDIKSLWPGLMRRTHTCEGVRKIGFHRFGAAHLCSGLSSWTTVEGGAGRRRGAQSRTCDTPNRWRSWEWACATRRWLQWPARVRGWRAPRATTFPRGYKMLVYAGTIRSLPFLPVCAIDLQRHINEHSEQEACRHAKA